ncbi:MAG TPA: hypothetical protein VIJ04_00285 [Xanthobacteraceae bacterium]
MRAVVGRQSPSAPGKAVRKGAKLDGSAQKRPDSDYLVALTTFHIRPRLPR